MLQIILVNLIVTIISIVNGQGQQFPQQQSMLVSMNNFPNGINNQQSLAQLSIGIPFPQCLSTDTASSILNPSFIEKLFQNILQEEDRKLKQERVRNDQFNNKNIMDFDAVQLRADTLNGALIARVATKVSVALVSQLGCITNSSITKQLDDFLTQIRLPRTFCPFDPDANCNGFTRYRTITGVCNNLAHPYQGSSQTAFARLLPAAYEDGLHIARSQSVLGGPLPSCRDISLNLGSNPVFSTSYNSLFVTYGQFLVHDITMAMPVTDSGRTPITSCSCSTQDTELCTTVSIAPNDPFLGQQKCIAMPATSQAFANQICSLGVKDQINGNSHYIDLSVTYGSTRATATGLRAGQGGLLKAASRPWLKFEIPPGQREALSCTDGNEQQRCFAGGDSRLMENLVLAGIQTQWLRLHNKIARELATIRPDWRNDDNILYEETKKIMSGLHQRYTYEDWLRILLGPQLTRKYTGDNGLFSQYDPNTPGVVINEAVTGSLRLHTLVRNTYTRCKPNGQLIDQVWFHDISAKCKLAYDSSSNGIDSFLCGALFDFGSAADTNYADEIHNHLFETRENGQLKSSDLISMNICRGREHGIPGYNAYRALCGLRRATRFEDFSDTMSAENIQNLKMIYAHPEDVDIFVGVNHETPVPDGLVGPVSACLIGTQFHNLKYGDRFFYKHQGQFTPEQLRSIQTYNYNCFICHSTDIDRVPLNPFRPPDDRTNPLVPCSQCQIFDLNPWR